MRILAHHSEAVDPTLIDWIMHQINAVLGIDSVVMALLLGLLLVLFPATLLTLVWLQRRKMAQRAADHQQD